MTTQGKGSGGGHGGKGKPPKEHQWTKGESGNAKGRPPKAKKPLPSEIVDMILAEASRTITLTEGGKPVSMTADKAVLRAQLVSAMTANSHAQRSWIQQVSNAQAQKQRQKEEAIAAAVKLKMELECARIEWVAEGGDEINMALHPSDIEIDYETGEVKNFLALTGEDRKARTRRVEHRDYFLERIARSLVVATEDGDDALLQMGRNIARTVVLTINEHLPSRFRRVPPGDVPALGPNCSPVELWEALLQPTVDLMKRRLDKSFGKTPAGKQPSSPHDGDALGQKPSGRPTAVDGRKPSSEEDDGEENNQVGV